MGTSEAELVTPGLCGVHGEAEFILGINAIYLFSLITDIVSRLENSGEFGVVNCRRVAVNICDSGLVFMDISLIVRPILIMNDIKTYILCTGGPEELEFDRFNDDEF